MFLNFHTHKTTHKESEIFNTEWASIERIQLNIKEYADQYFSAGIHPQQSEQYLLKIPTLEIVSQNSNCLAIGECGLDKIISIPLPDQCACFENQIQLSEQHQLPLILHCVKAWNEVLQIRKKLNPKQKWIFHGFRKTSILKNVLDEGLMIGVGTAVLFDEKLQNSIPLIPDDRLLLETDNDTEHSIEEVYKKVAELKKIKMEKLQEITECNFKKMFLKFDWDTIIKSK